MTRRSLRLGAVWIAAVAAFTLTTGSAGAGVTPTPSDATAGASAPAAPAADLPDPLKKGPHDVTATEYNYGDTAFNPPDFPGPIEVRASVHYPTDLDDGPLPLVMLMHGRHSTCYKDGAATGGWPCPAGYSSITSFQGYDYLAENLASWGYIVVSVSANGINARDSGVQDAGMTARGELMQYHLDLWQKFSTKGADPFGKLFVGKVDMQNVGEMGHSRGGEGVVRNYQINEELGSPYGIQAVFPLAPVDFGRETLPDVPLSVMLPYCDGDVSDLQGVHFYDDSRYTSPNDQAPKYVQEVLGANHNFFNTVWTPGEFPAGTFDDSTCRSIGLTAQQQRDVGEAYMAAFFRLHLGGETDFAPYFNGSDNDPASISPAEVHTSYQAAADDRLDVNRYLDDKALTKNFLGGAVIERRLTPFDLCGGPVPQPAQCLPVSPSQQPHTTGARPGLSQLRYGWEKAAGHVTNRIPRADGDVSDFATLTFRVARDFADPRNPAGSVPDFTVRITDGSGAHADVAVSKYSDALFAQPGSGSGLPKLVLNTVRLPLAGFDGVDLTDVAKVTFRHDLKKTGAILTTDLAFTDQS